MKTRWAKGDRINCDMTFDAIKLEGVSSIPDGFIAGIASTPSTDSHGHKVLAKAFDDSIKKKGLSGPAGIKLLAGHDWNKVAGQIKRLDTVNNNLLLEAQLYLDVSYVKDLYTVVKNNGGLSFSVGFSLEEFEFNDVMENDDDPWLIVQKGDLMEVSVVTFPSQPEAQMTFVKMFGNENIDELETMTEFEKALVADGLCNNRSQAHRFTAWAKQNVHLLQPKLPLLGDKAAKTEIPYPMLDASMLKPMADLIAKARAQLP